MADSPLEIGDLPGCQQMYSWSAAKQPFMTSPQQTVDAAITGWRCVLSSTLEPSDRRVHGSDGVLAFGSNNAHGAGRLMSNPFGGDAQEIGGQ